MNFTFCLGKQRCYIPWRLRQVLYVGSLYIRRSKFGFCFVQFIERIFENFPRKYTDIRITFIKLLRIVVCPQMSCQHIVYWGNHIIHWKTVMRANILFLAFFKEKSMSRKKRKCLYSFFEKRFPYKHLILSCFFKQKLQYYIFSRKPRTRGISHKPLPVVHFLVCIIPPQSILSIILVFTKSLASCW